MSDNNQFIHWSPLSPEHLFIGKVNHTVLVFGLGSLSLKQAGRQVLCKIHGRGVVFKLLICSRFGFHFHSMFSSSLLSKS